MTEFPSASIEHVSGDRLESWKEIAAYLRRDVKTVQRWEKREGMPVHRHVHDKMGSVYAFRSKLDEWAQNRRLTIPAEGPAAQANAEPSPRSAGPPKSKSKLLFAVAATMVGVAVAASLFLRDRDPANPLTNAKFLPLTDFSGVEQAAAISRDGNLVAFLSDRDGQMDVWVTQVGSGEFHNLTHGAARELINSSVRTLDFSPDGTLVNFWTRRLDASQQSQISIWSVPVLGGSSRVFLEGVAEYHWSDDTTRLVYHTPGPGDPMFVRDATAGSQPRQIFSAPAGLHGHFPLWSRDRSFIYFVQGSVPDRMDIWRLKSGGGAPERITNHDAAVSYPVFVDPQTLLYLARDPDGSGPWIYAVDVERRVPQRASFGIERYTSLAASSDGRRLVATLATPKNTLLRVPIGSEPAKDSDARPITLTTGNGSSPRLGDGFLLYISSTGTGDSIWKQHGDRATQLWTSPQTRVIGGPALARDGRRVAFSTRRDDGPTMLWVVNNDGTDARTLTTSLQLQGAPTWTSDGEGVAIGAVVDGVPNLFRVPIDGGAPVRLLREHSSDPAWSPDGDIVVFSGADVGTTFKLKAIDAKGQPYSIPELTLTRGARHIAFIEGKRSLVYLRGDMRHKNLWTVDLETGAERQLTNFAPGFDLRDFDVAPDGREIVVEQTLEHSDIVLLERRR